MGEVYLAEDTTLGHRVALKLLPPEHTRDEERLWRFKQEAKSASALNHPNILTIHEVGEADGHHFIATEFIDGETLRALLRRSGSMTTDEVLNVAVQVASALTAAHAAGIVHRDIKPENIMRAPRRLRQSPGLRTRQADRARGARAGRIRACRPERLRRTPRQASCSARRQYMSPEQATGKTVDARSDIFSFGAVLYEMVGGQRAFRARPAMETLAAVINQEPKPLPARVPPESGQVDPALLAEGSERGATRPWRI